MGSRHRASASDARGAHAQNSWANIAFLSTYHNGRGQSYYIGHRAVIGSYKASVGKFRDSIGTSKPSVNSGAGKDNNGLNSRKYFDNYNA